MARKTYSTEFRQEAVRLTRESKRAGRSLGQVARELGVHEGTLRLWMHRDDSEHAGTDRNTEGLTPEQELEQLRKENRILKMEREILKKAAAFFAKENS